MSETTGLSRTLRIVQGLINKAEHPNTDPIEAQACREKADALMLKAAITEAQLNDARPAAERGQPKIIEVPIAGDADLRGFVEWMAQVIARHTRCKIRTYSRWDRETRTQMAKVMGWESDVAYFEMLYTTVRLHMLGILRPEISPTESIEDNAYRLHNAGYNWYEIAQLQGWRETTPEPGEARFMYWNRKTGERGSYAQVIGVWKNAYNRAVKAKGERPVKIAPGAGENYRFQAANGYTDMINNRLRRMAAQPTGGAALVLSSRNEDLENLWREANANQYTRCESCGKLSANIYVCDRCGAEIKARPEPCKRCQAAKSGRCREHSYRASYRTIADNPAAYAAGARHAQSADLLGNTRMGGGSRKGLGS